MECDASVMDGHSGAFGAVGAVSGILHASSSRDFRLGD